MFELTPEKYEKIKGMLFCAIFISLVILMFALFKDESNNNIESSGNKTEELINSIDITEDLIHKTETTFEE